jgi:hypothetical protein
MNENIFPYEFITKLNEDLNLSDLKEQLLKLFETDSIQMYDFSLFILEQKVLNQKRVLKLIIILIHIG